MGIFIKFDKKVVRGSCTDKWVLLVLAYLYRNKTMQNTIALTLDNLVLESGYKVNHHKGKTNDKFKFILKSLIEDGVIIYKGDVLALKPSQFFRVTLPEKSIFDVSTNYVELQDYELNKIIKSATNIDKGLLLKSFLCIKSFINMDDVSYKLAYPSIRTLREDINVSSNDTVENIVEALAKLELIFSKNVGSYKKGDQVRNAPICYALEKSDLDSAEDFIKAQFGIDELYPVPIDNLSFVVHKKPKPKNRIINTGTKIPDVSDTWGEEEFMEMY